MSAFVPSPPAFPPPQTMVPVAYSGAGGTAASSGGSYGPVIAMLAVLAVLAALAVAVGRLCFGRRALGRAGGHDLEAWVERKCAPCVGARTRSSGSADGDVAKEEEGGGTAAEQRLPEGMERGESSGGASRDSERPIHGSSLASSM